MKSASVDGRIEQVKLVLDQTAVPVRDRDIGGVAVAVEGEQIGAGCGGQSDKYSKNRKCETILRYTFGVREVNFTYNFSSRNLAGQ